jgi:xanthine dehydrogenase accessory factor
VLRQDLSERSTELRASRVPFVHARVVLAEAPTSAKPGDEAIILGDGTLEGFVGGTCAETTVRDQSLALLATGEALVVRITPTQEADQPGKRVVYNPCLSGGTLEVFLEPSVPVPLVLVVGDAPIAKAIQSIGTALHYSVIIYTGEIPPDTAALVVASHGRGEEEALTAALDARVPYIGLVASARRGRAVLDGLEVSEEGKARIHTPAGLNIGAMTSEEVALSILAEIVTARPRPAPSYRPRSATITAPATDPVCGMTVLPGVDTLHLEEGGRTVWFCGRGCKEAFAAQPAAYPTAG